MMFKYTLLILFFISNTLNAQDINALRENEKLVREIINKEEQFSRLKEKEILEAYTISSITHAESSLNYNLYTSTTNEAPHFLIILGENSPLLKNANLMALYENNIQRSRTYIEKVDKNTYKVYILLKDKLAKLLLRMYYMQGKVSLRNENAQFLIDKKNSRGLSNHLSVYNSSVSSTNPSPSRLYYVHKQRILKGPYIINEIMLSTYDTNKALYDFIPNGVLIYDSKAKKYTKTPSGIMELK